jgi:hypothetical protein
LVNRRAHFFARTKGVQLANAAHFRILWRTRILLERGCLPVIERQRLSPEPGRLGQPAGGLNRYTFRREKLVEVDGKVADAVLGEFNGTPRHVIALEGKGSKDPLDRPYAGRKMSAVDQGYRYAINLPCDWILVTSMRQSRLYFKGADHRPAGKFNPR